MTSTAIRRARRDDRDRVVDTVVSAFADDPAFRYFFGDRASLDRLAPVFAGFLFDLRVGRGSVWVTDDGDAAALWSPPSGTRPSPTRIPVPEFGEAGRRMEVYEDGVHGAMPEEPHWYLGVLASHPRRRGEGLARRVAAAGIEEARRDGVMAYLETVTASNVALYERLGWRIHAEVPDVGGLHVRVMQYDPGVDLASST